MAGVTELKVYFLSSVNNIPSLLVWGFVVVSIIGLGVLVWRNGWREGFRASAVQLLVEWVILILYTAVLLREPHSERQWHLLPLWSYFHNPENSYFIEAAAVNALNVIMFVPVGLLLGIGFKDLTWKSMLMVGAVISVSIELLQFVFKKGLCESDDLIHNLLGCLLGFAIYKLTLRLIRYV